MAYGRQNDFAPIAQALTNFTESYLASRPNPAQQQAAAANQAKSAAELKKMEAETRLLRQKGDQGDMFKEAIASFYSPEATDRDAALNQLIPQLAQGLAGRGQIGELRDLLGTVAAGQIDDARMNDLQIGGGGKAMSLDQVKAQEALRQLQGGNLTGDERRVMIGVQDKAKHQLYDMGEGVTAAGNPNARTLTMNAIPGNTLMPDGSVEQGPVDPQPITKGGSDTPTAIQTAALQAAAMGLTLGELQTLKVLERQMGSNYGMSGMPPESRKTYLDLVDKVQRHQAQPTAQ